MVLNFVMPCCKNKNDCKITEDFGIGIEGILAKR
jgi:hypothetical protein